MSIEKLRFVLLSDFYGNLLTEKQREFLKLHYEEDLSFGEIAERFGVTRQAVYDSIKAAEIALECYESVLGLLSDFQQQRAVLSDILEHLQILETQPNGPEKGLTIQHIRACIQVLMD